MYIEIGYSKESIVSEEEIQRQLSLTLENLKDMHIIDSHKLVDYEAIVMDPAYVHITKDGLKVVEQITKSLHSAGVYFMGRYGLWKYCSIEDCMVDSMNVVKAIKLIKNATSFI